MLHLTALVSSPRLRVGAWVGSLGRSAIGGDLHPVGLVFSQPGIDAPRVCFGTSVTNRFDVRGQCGVGVGDDADVLLAHRSGMRNEDVSQQRARQCSRVKFFMNKFRKLGFIEYNGGLRINNSLLSVVLRD